MKIRPTDISREFGIPDYTLRNWKDAKDWRKEHYAFLENILKIKNNSERKSLQLLYDKDRYLLLRNLVEQRFPIVIGGIYMLTYKREIVYIGASKSLPARIKNHIASWNKLFDNFIFIEDNDEESRKEMETELIYNLCPLYNKSLGLSYNSRIDAFHKEEGNRLVKSKTVTHLYIEEAKEEILRDYTQGWGLLEIAKKHYTGANVLTKVMKEWGVVIP